MTSGWLVVLASVAAACDVSYEVCQSSAQLVQLARDSLAIVQAILLDHRVDLTHATEATAWIAS